jgi:hypothetical protein
MQTTKDNSVRPVNNPASAVALIRAEFPGVTVADIKRLSETDRLELASGIATSRGLTPEQLAFTPVEY